MFGRSDDILTSEVLAECRVFGRLVVREHLEGPAELVFVFGGTAELVVSGGLLELKVSGWLAERWASGVKATANLVRKGNTQKIQEWSPWPG